MNMFSIVSAEEVLKFLRSKDFKELHWVNKPSIILTFSVLKLLISSISNAWQL